ncbi:unnamed protein product [Durusdinium trenchii]|uniref:Uncharacterized protein n=1 Tax=Durusdinium trenchii TaxID=1381693 RepID=A0ABP0I2S6_9DINO
MAQLKPAELKSAQLKSALPQMLKALKSAQKREKEFFREDRENERAEAVLKLRDECRKERWDGGIYPVLECGVWSVRTAGDWLRRLAVGRCRKASSCIALVGSAGATKANRGPTPILEAAIDGRLFADTAQLPPAGRYGLMGWSTWNLSIGWLGLY